MSEAKTENKAEKKFSPFEVSWLFVQEYYTIMNNSPEKLHQFYNKDSYYCNGSEGESSTIYHGQAEINKRIKELEYEDCKVLVSNVDSQVSSGDGIIIQVLGEMSNKGGASHKFAQTFFLAKQPNGYFVLNDIIRFLKEDIENEYEDFDTPNENYATQEYMENQSNTMMTEEVIEQMNESLVLDADANLDEKANLESMETHPTMEEKKVETEPLEEKHESPANTTPAANAVTTNTSSNNELNTTKTNATTTTTTTTAVPPAATTTNSTTAPTTELTESATEAEPKRTNQVKSFATVTASNTTTTATTTHYKEVSKIESKPLPNSNNQKNNQGRGRQDQKSGFDKEIFIKDINENVSREKIKEAFSKFGEVKKVDVFYNRRSGFVEFISLDSAKSAIAAKSVLIDGHKIIAEEKHKRKGFNNSYNNRNRNDYRDRGYQSGKNGSYVNRGKSIRTK